MRGSSRHARHPSRQRALEYSPVRLINGRLDEDLAPEPRMKPILKLPGKRSCGRSQTLFYNRRRRIRALTRERRMRPTSPSRRSRRRHEALARDFDASSGRATPSRRRIKIAKPRSQHNPAGIHLNSAGRCSDNRDQLFPLMRRQHSSPSIRLHQARPSPRRREWKRRSRCWARQSGQIIHINDAPERTTKSCAYWAVLKGFLAPRIRARHVRRESNPSARRRSDVKGARRRLIESRDLDPGCKERISHP